MDNSSINETCSSSKKSNKALHQFGIKSYLRIGSVILTTVVLFWIGYLTFEGRFALRKSNELLSQGETIGSIAYAYQAARCYVPFARHSVEAHKQLRQIALDAETKADFEIALVAWQSMRSSILSTQSLWVPFRAHLNEANVHIAWLLSHKSISSQSQHTQNQTQSVSYHRSWLEQTSSHNVYTVSLFYTGILLWTFGFWKLTKALDQHSISKTSSIEPTTSKSPLIKPALHAFITLTGLLALTLSLLKA